MPERTSLSDPADHQTIDDFMDQFTSLALRLKQATQAGLAGRRTRIIQDSEGDTASSRLGKASNASASQGSHAGAGFEQGIAALLAPAARTVLESLQSNGAQTVPHLARTRGTSRQNIQVIVNRLKGGGYVELMKNPAHRRSELVCLTDKGEGVLQDSPDPREYLLKLLRENLSATELREGVQLLQRIAQLLAPPGTRSSPRKPYEKGSEPPRRVASSAKLEEEAVFAQEQNELPVNLL